MSQHYESNLDYDAKAMAQLTEIAFGWVQRPGLFIDPNEQTVTEWQEVLCGCNVCGFCVSKRWKPGYDESDAERRMTIEFNEQAKLRHCPHWQKFLEVRGNPEYKQAVDWLAVILSMQGREAHR